MDQNYESNSLSLGLVIILIAILIIVASIVGSPKSAMKEQILPPVQSEQPTGTGEDAIPFKVFAYYPYWKYVEFPITRVRTSAFDGISLAFIWPDTMGNIILPKGLAPASFIKPLSASGKTMTISVGGWQRSAGFENMTGNPQILDEFVKNLSRFVQDNGYNAVNIDWEYPNGPEDSKTLAELGKKIREALPGLLVTASLPMIPSIHKIDIDAIHKHFDQIHVMAYDIESGWGGYGGHNAPLRPNTSMPRDLSIETLLKTEYLDLNVPKEKIVLGLPLYGRKYNTPEPYQPLSESEPVEYKDLPFKICAKDASNMSGPLLKCAGYYISYDDAESLKAKIEFAKKLGLAGVFFWALGQDSNLLIDELGM